MASAEDPNEPSGVQRPIGDEQGEQVVADNEAAADQTTRFSGISEAESPAPFDTGEPDPEGDVDVHSSLREESPVKSESDEPGVAADGLTPQEQSQRERSQPEHGAGASDPSGGRDASKPSAGLGPVGQTTATRTDGADSPDPVEGSATVERSVRTESTATATATATRELSAQPAADVDDSEDWMTSGAGHPRRWAILGVLVVSLLVVVIDNTVLNIALPTIQSDLQASQSELVWSVDSYILVFAAFLFTWGVLGDKFGRKKILVIGLVVFVTASIASAFAVSAPMLIGTRALMGIGGAAVMPVTLAIITVVFPPHERGKAIGVWAGSVGAAVALGPVLGGLLLEHPEWSNWLTQNDWGAVFLINVPIVALGLFGIWRVVPESKNPDPQRLDLVGLVLSVTGLGLLIYGIVNASTEQAWITPSVMIPAGAGIMIIALFLVYEAKSDHKSFDVGLFKNRGYAVSLSAVSLSFFAMVGITFSLPFYFQILRDMSTLQSGLAFLPFAIGQFIAAPQSARLVDKFGYRAVMGTGLALVALALAGLTMLEIESSLALILTGFFFFGLGMGMVIAPATSLMQNVLPLARAGAGSAVQNTVRQVFGALGVAIVGTIIGTQYAKNVSGSFDPLGPEFPTDQAIDSVVATDRSLAVAEQQGAPAEVVDQVRDEAYRVFLDAAHLTMTISAAVVVVALVLVVFALPKIRPPRIGDSAPRDTWDEPESITQHEIAVEQGLAAPDPPGSTQSNPPGSTQSKGTAPGARGGPG